jgi:hypothetical protein
MMPVVCAQVPGFREVKTATRCPQFLNPLVGNLVPGCGELVAIFLLSSGLEVAGRLLTCWAGVWAMSSLRGRQHSRSYQCPPPQVWSWVVWLSHGSQGW